MSRLPTPGGDNNNWGTILNDYLQQSLAPDGTLVTTPTNSYTSTTNTNLANSTRPGLVQLAGDLAVPYSAPKVAGLQGVSIASTTPVDGQALVYKSSNSSWQPVTINSGGAIYAGVLDGGSATAIYGGITPIDCGASV